MSTSATAVSPSPPSPSHTSPSHTSPSHTSPNLKLGLTADLIEQGSYDAAVVRFRERGIVMPTFAQLASPGSAPADAVASLAGIDPDTPDARNLWRVHWYNAHDRRSRVDVPVHLVLPPSLTAVPCPIVVVLGYVFPMVRVHKVLAAYSCLAPRIVTGQFDPTTQRAIWPSTGNYARGGVAISRIMACRGTAILPEGMSRERFEWLERWTEDPSDIIKTVGTESNVKEIYDACNALERDPSNVILNQFCEFANHLGHWAVTGRALAHVYEHVAASMGSTAHPRLAAFTSATGSAGTIAAGDHLKDLYGTKIVAVEAVECPTMLENGFGEHNIQGIGDKHIPLIHNVTNTDAVTGISDQATDHLDLLFNSDAGKAHLRDRMHVPAEVVERLTHLGFSSIANILAAIKTAKWYGYGENDVVITIATDGSELYPSEQAKLLAREYPDGFDAVDAADTAGRYLASVDTQDYLELSARDRNRIFNLGYYTWVEQQGISVEEFETRRSQDFWRGIRPLVAAWDERITEFNERVAAG